MATFILWIKWANIITCKYVWWHIGNLDVGFVLQKGAEQEQITFLKTLKNFPNFARNTRRAQQSHIMITEGWKPLWKQRAVNPNVIQPVFKQHRATKSVICNLGKRWLTQHRHYKKSELCPNKTTVILNTCAQVRACLQITPLVKNKWKSAVSGSCSWPCLYLPAIIHTRLAL